MLPTGSGRNTPPPSAEELDDLLIQSSAAEPKKSSNPTDYALQAEVKALRADHEKLKSNIRYDIETLQKQLGDILEILAVMQQSSFGFREVKGELAALTDKFRKMSERQDKINSLFEKTKPDPKAASEDSVPQEKIPVAEKKEKAAVKSDKAQSPTS